MPDPAERKAMAAAFELPGAATSNAGWLQRVGLLVLAVFVAVMHHVVGAHAHGGDAASMAVSHAHSGTASPVMHAFPSGPLGSQESVVGSPSTLPQASVDARSDAAVVPQAASLELAGHAMAMLHLCLAVLAAVAALAALLLIAVALAERTAPGITPTGWLSRGPRPPPSARRQARLQVLRL